nr:hypothetical protein 11 [Candidatus Omnitrophota bacterium]
MSKWKKHLFVEGEVKKWWDLYYFRVPLQSDKYTTMIKFSLAELDDENVALVKHAILIENNTGAVAFHKEYKMNYSSMLEAVMMSRKFTEEMPKKLSQRISEQEYTNELSLAVSTKYRLEQESLREKEKEETLKSESETEIIKTIETPKKPAIMEPVIKWFKKVLIKPA